MSYLESFSVLVGMTVVLLAAGALYVRFLVTAGRLRSGPIRTLSAFAAYLILAVLVVLDIILIIDLDVFGFSRRSEFVEIGGRVVCMLLTVIPMLIYVLWYRRKDLAGAGFFV